MAVFACVCNPARKIPNRNGNRTLDLPVPNQAISRIAVKSIPYSKAVYVLLIPNPAPCGVYNK
ncbi:hypothetical protein DPMN_112991 [Dreissena polymorpha]|uniref:Uncharacterized protein n=1 Tax=Dreissena polymorpha TaxID=45954 RepID=A0A9D4KHG0_DREPO|nr:hypothetical protein DPMN_112991 [Dreissena polymorpha]